MMHTCYAHEVDHHLSDDSWRRFRPRGPMHVIDGSARSKSRRAAEDHVENWGVGLAARVFVGLNVGDKPRYTIQDVVQATKEIRRQQGLLPDATFIAQKGLYTEPKEKGGSLVEENSVQIIIFDTEGSTMDAFSDKIVKLARGLRERFDQDSVIVELQEAGVSQNVLAVKRD
jgi:hypothetical protein